MTFNKLIKMKTLLIDDDEFVRDSLRLMFESRGCLLNAVESAEEAVDMLDHRSYDILITDYMLPGMNGIELCRRLNVTHPRLKKILITAYGSRSVEVEASAAGVDEFIEKPITSETLKRSLSRLFDKMA
jgi:CheY-like chemotaxis protein